MSSSISTLECSTNKCKWTISPVSGEFGTVTLTGTKDSCTVRIDETVEEDHAVPHSATGECSGCGDDHFEVDSQNKWFGDCASDCVTEMYYEKFGEAGETLRLVVATGSVESGGQHDLYDILLNEDARFHDIGPSAKIVVQVVGVEPDATGGLLVRLASLSGEETILQMAGDAVWKDVELKLSMDRQQTVCLLGPRGNLASQGRVADAQGTNEF